MNLLFTCEKPSRLAASLHVEQWRRAGHIVESMPFHRVASYAHFGGSLGLLDAIVCDTNTQVVEMSGVDWTRLYPLDNAIKLAFELQNLPGSSAMRDGRKWNSLPFIILPNSSDYSADYWVDLPKTIAILPLACNHSPEFSAHYIQQCVDRYYDAILKDYEKLGLLIRLERGHIQLGPALMKRDPSLESQYYYAQADLRKNRRWVTVRRDNEGLRNDVERFQLMLDQRANERAMHGFFEEHPTILMEAMQGIPLSHRPSFRVPAKTQPDYAFISILGSYGRTHVDLLELKGPSDLLLTRSKLHAGFAAKVHHAIDQVRDYDRYLRDAKNKEAIRRDLGYVPNEANLAVLIGRTPRREAEREVFSQRQSELNVKVVTYDEILRTQASRISRF